MTAFEEAYVFTRILTGNKLEVAVAVDGSKVAIKALELGISFLQKERNDRLDLIHVVDEHASAMETPEHIEKSCELVASAAGVTFNFHKEHKDELGVINTLAKAAERIRADLLLVGAYGLRIEQGAQDEVSFSVAGKVSDGSLRRSDVSVGVVKASSYDLEEGGARTIMLATDDTPSSRVAFTLLLTKLAKKTDRIIIFTNHENWDTMLGKYKVECDKLGVQCELYGMHNPSTSVSDDILAYAQDKQVDLLVLGTNGYGQKVLGSVSDKCCKEARCSVIVVKDPRSNTTGSAA